MLQLIVDTYYDGDDGDDFNQQVVFNSRDLWRWRKNPANSIVTEIPYEFDDQQDPFEDAYKKMIRDVINDLNSEEMLGGCIRFRYVLEKKII